VAGIREGSSVGSQSTESSHDAGPGGYPTIELPIDPRLPVDPRPLGDRQPPVGPQPPVDPQLSVDPALLSDRQPADHGRLSPALIGAVALALALFVAGVAWAVIRPSPSAGTAPEGIATYAPFGSQPTGDAGKPSATSQPTASAHPSRSASLAASPSASVPASPGRGGSGPTGTVSVSLLPLQGAQVNATVAAGATDLTGWQATVTCRPGVNPDSIQLWGASRVDAGGGDAGTWLTVRNQSWNGTVAAGGTTTFGFMATRTSPGDLTCTIAVTARSAAV
jgi:Cellulose binding domain